jgi:dTDP-4-amino-4,6-dideoxygalactose transaminase
MIPLFKVPNATVSTATLGNILHGEIVDQFEKNFAKYVGAKYAVSFNSASSAIFLALKTFCPGETIAIPSMIPPVVPNAIYNAGCNIRFGDDIGWIGHMYQLVKTKDIHIIDSAQAVKKDQFKSWSSLGLISDETIIIYSFYPTKPVSSCDGGMAVSNCPEQLDMLRTLSRYGMTTNENSWEREQIAYGWKMYMNSIQAYIANKNLFYLPAYQKKLEDIRNKYNKAFGYMNSSHHLYRVIVKNNSSTIAELKKAGIQCGIHYKPLHNHSFYGRSESMKSMEQTEYLADKTLSIPFHTSLVEKEINKIIDAVKPHLELSPLTYAYTKPTEI